MQHDNINMTDMTTLLTDYSYSLVNLVQDLSFKLVISAGQLRGGLLQGVNGRGKACLLWVV